MASRESARAGRQRVPARLWLLSVLALTATVVVLIDFVPASDYDSPTLRATVETVMTLFAFGGAWLLRAQFGSLPAPS